MHCTAMRQPTSCLKPRTFTLTGTESSDILVIKIILVIVLVSFCWFILVIISFYLVIVANSNELTIVTKLKVNI